MIEKISKGISEGMEEMAVEKTAQGIDNDNNTPYTSTLPLKSHMKYIKATSDMANDIYSLLHTTIKTVYPKYYPKEVVDFFCRHHSKEHILDGIASGNMGVLMDGDVIVGTGCFNGNHITGVYVLPSYQKQGCGSYIMNCLETEIAKNFEKAILDASLPAACLYENRGYKTVGHGIFELENDVKLVYEIMEKELKYDEMHNL